ncbi:MAG: alanine racemase [Actinomycetota bacterium]
MSRDVDALPTWAEVDLGAITRNVTRLKNLLTPATQLLTVVKAGGYGHGDTQASAAAIAGGATWLGVARVQEGRALRDAGVESPILLLAEPPSASVAEVVELDLTPTLYSEATADAFTAAVRGRSGKVGVHLKVDTGMHRYGVPPGSAAHFWNRIESSGSLEVRGIWSHFAVAEDVLNPFTKQQFELFMDVLGSLGSRIDGVIRHIANSAGTITFPQAHLDMVRSGIAAYGIHPSPDLTEEIELDPAMSLKSRIGLIKKLPKGEPISYGQRYTMPNEGFLATIPCGYADGMRRGLTNRGDVLINGKRYPICGSITMDHFLVDTGTDEMAIGDEVVILGSQGKEQISAQEIADNLETIPYEIVCGISSRVPRIYRG